MSPHQKRQQAARKSTPDRPQASRIEGVPSGADKSEEYHATAQQPPAGVQPVEPQDSYLIGAHTAQQRKLLELNTATRRPDRRKPEAQPDPDIAPGQHATGSNVDMDKKK